MTYQDFLQRYQYDPVADRIGKGGFGVVFKAYDTHLDRFVAIKMSEVEDDLDSMRLAREVELAAKLPTHPNIAHYEACYTFATPTGKYDFGILQFYNEGSLNDIMAKDGLNQEQKINILCQILDGIEFLHTNNVVHRDLKPRNILIARRGNNFIPKITDFGMSKEFEEGDSSRFGNSITGAGTLAYASPEQLGEKQMRRNADLWSFGIIAFQLFTGELPFNSGSHPATSSAGRIELFRQINSGIIPPTINAVAEPWQKLIRKLLIVDPNTRPRSCADVRKIIVGDFDEPKANETVSPSDETISENSQQKQTVIVDETIRENAYSNQQFEDSTYREQNFNTTNSDVTQQPITNEDSECIVDSHIPDLNTNPKRLVWVMKILGQSVLLTFINAVAEPWQKLIRKLLIVDPNTRPRSCADVRKIIVGDFDEPKANETVSPSDETISENSQQKQTVIVDETIRENAYSNQQFEDSTYREQNFNTTNSDVTQQPITNEDSECIVDSHIPDLNTNPKRLVWVMKILGQSVLLTFINAVAEPWQKLIRKLLIVDPNTRPRSCADVRKIIVGDFDEPKANETVSPSDETISENSQQKQTVIVDETIRENAYSNQQFEDSTYREQNFNTTNSDVTQQPITNEDSECIVDSHIPDLNTNPKRLVWVMKILGQSVLLTFITVIGEWLYGNFVAEDMGFYRGIYGNWYDGEGPGRAPYIEEIAMHEETICYFLSSFLILLILNYVLSQRAKLTTKKSLQKRRITEQIIFFILVFSNFLILDNNLYIYNENLLGYLLPLTYTVLNLPYIDTPKKRIIFGIISGISILTLILLPFIPVLWY